MNYENSTLDDIGYIVIKPLQNGYFMATFESTEKRKRIREILTTIHNGLISHTSSESNTIVPIFTIIGDVTIPSPVFHPFIDVKKTDKGNLKLLALKMQ